MYSSAVCTTDVTAYSMSYEMLKTVRERNESLDKALDIVERDSIDQGHLYLDYILYDKGQKRFFAYSKLNSNKIMHNYEMEKETN